MARKLMAVLGALVVLSMVLTACATPTPERIVETVIETVEVEVPVEVEVEVPVEVEVEVPVEVIVEVTPEPVDRQGAWLDTVIMSEEPSTQAAVRRLQTGDLDVYAYSVADPNDAAAIYAAEGLEYAKSYGSYNELTFNTVGPEFEDGRLNPFSVPKIREAMNWLVDRNYVVEEISGGMAVPRYTAINFASQDTALLASEIAAVELTYANDPDRAAAVVTEEMEKLGAEMVDGIWQYNGEPVEIIGLIRVEDERTEIGDYFANLLEDIGFTVTRDYKTSAEASTCWIQSDPWGGCMNYYTGGWVSTAISRDEGSNFSFFYTPDGYTGVPLWDNYTPTEEFYQLSRDLLNNNFSSMEERREMMVRALTLSMEDSARIWLKDDTGISPYRKEISVAADLSGSVYGAWLWAQTLRVEGQVGGSVNIGVPSIMTEPWNPVDGSNWVYDMMPMRGIAGAAVVYDPYTGLFRPMRLESADVYIEEGLPVGKSLDWVNLEFVSENVVPDDAWADWDPVNQVFITAGEKYTETQTAKAKVVMTYPAGFPQDVKWHDGSSLSLADMVFSVALYFDRAQEESAIFDAGAVGDFTAFMQAFKGWRIASTDPVVIEYYTDAYGLDAENNVDNFRAMYPSPDGMYAQGSGAWHNMAAAWLAESEGELAFSSSKAEELEVEWMSFIGGPSLEIMKTKLDTAQEEGFIPYEPTLSQYLADGEAEARYTNLQEWYRVRNHFYLGTGPFFLADVFPVEGTLILQHNPDYPDNADRWSQFSEAPVPTVLLDGPGQVGIGEEAVYDVFVDLEEGVPYPIEDISIAQYLVFDATGALAFTGDATAVEDGYWQVTLGSDITGELEAGSNRLAIIVVSKNALVPVRQTVDFVTQ
ncbi:MAG: ABC transporter substrate-binding protein [Anaerolineae bacterium]|nr:ABC transporter substrate-binding protein [Anaerolineae bacterium]